MSMELLSGELDDSKVRDLFVIILARFGVYIITSGMFCGASWGIVQHHRIVVCHVRLMNDCPVRSLGRL